ncbi:tRNA lysidine(34) synthetase TilS [Microbacterium dextranolyticum]|uniref:tRNA(Ile)-lysidine synthase n=1 Tax=Microbacterium dextranolyticum TaxID=36806 RepID=A0A9W6HL52_9MICO|nr:tRNA lysidine(34) synthetase TilS [Microbacterium dextranolyticum]GLJ95270.1 tRNA(Ile)-lysidine synthase [Microbacterium dextranolyticum]
MDAVEHRPSLDPAVAEIRRAVRESLSTITGPVLVGLSGGADSLALVAAVAFEAPKVGVVVTATVIDHGLQPGSDRVAARAAAVSESLGVPARVVQVDVGLDGGPEAAARDARRRALLDAARTAGAEAVLLAHTLDDQAETVLIGLARGSGAASLGAMAPDRVEEGIRIIRPLLEVRRTQTRAACAAQGLPVWEDPHNLDRRFLRVRVRQDVMPVLEAELGPGVADALARTSDQLREDAAAFTEMIDETIEDIVEHAEAGIAVSVAALAANPPALRHRIIRHVVASEFGVSLTRAQTLEVARLVTDWRGQGPIDLPGCRAARLGARLEFTAAAGSTDSGPRRDERT